MERYHIHPEAAVYFVTFSIVEWLPMFVTEAACRIVADSLTFCHSNKELAPGELTEVRRRADEPFVVKLAVEDDHVHVRRHDDVGVDPQV